MTNYPRYAGLLLPLVLLAGCPSADNCNVGGTCAPANDLAHPMSGDMAGTCLPACSDTLPYCNAAQQCVACLIDEHCPPGQVCKALGQNNVCVPGCQQDARCSKVGTANTCCSNQCVDTQVDSHNCGGCNKPCEPLHAAGSCKAGVCVPGACMTGWLDCNGDPADGCEANAHVDPKNCTACGMACTFKNGTGACSDGCYLANCDFGWAHCSKKPDDGCEMKVLSDPNNCGDCGKKCPSAPHAAGACINAACVLTRCDPGWTDCDGNVANGCEIHTDTDVSNCGRCGMVCQQGLVCTLGGCTCPQCNIPHSMTKCVNNQCVFDTCVPGWGDCDNNQNNGCEVSLSSDANNCNGCGNVCPMNTPYCVQSACSVSTHAIFQLTTDATATPGCGDASTWYMQNFGPMTWDQCELTANKYGAQYVGSPNLTTMAAYARAVRWAGEKDAQNAYITTAGWNQLSVAAKNTQQNCVLGYANGMMHGNMTLNQSMASNANNQTYMVMDFGNINENTCYTKCLDYGARPLNPVSFGINNQVSHMIENHSCHGSCEYNGANYSTDGAQNHTYHCFIGYNP